MKLLQGTFSAAKLDTKNEKKKIFLQFEIIQSLRFYLVYDISSHRMIFVLILILARSLLRRRNGCNKERKQEET